MTMALSFRQMAIVKPKLKGFGLVRESDPVGCPSWIIFAQYEPASLVGSQLSNLGKAYKNLYKSLQEFTL